eukprot:8810773-Lingulodinium_polyedra.AAC.1
MQGASGGVAPHSCGSPGRQWDRGAGPIACQGPMVEPQGVHPARNHWAAGWLHRGPDGQLPGSPGPEHPQWLPGPLGVSALLACCGGGGQRPLQQCQHRPLGLASAPRSQEGQEGATSDEGGCGGPCAQGEACQERGQDASH